MNWLLLFAILGQSLDMYSTCHLLNRGFVEANPLLGNDCKTIIIRKTTLITPLLMLNKKSINIVVGIGGLIGFTWNITR